MYRSEGKVLKKTNTKKFSKTSGSCIQKKVSAHQKNISMKDDPAQQGEYTKNQRMEACEPKRRVLVFKLRITSPIMHTSKSTITSNI